MLQVDDSLLGAMKLWRKLGTDLGRKKYFRKLSEFKKLKPKPLDLNVSSRCADFFSFAGWYDCSALARRISLEGRQKCKKKDLEAIATECNNLAIALRNQGDFEASLELHQQSIKLLKQKFGKDHLKYAEALRSYGFTLSSLSMYDQALVHAKEAFSFFLA